MDNSSEQVEKGKSSLKSGILASKKGVGRLSSIFDSGTSTFSKLFGGFGKLTLSIFAGCILIIATLLVIVSVFPMGNLLQTGSQLNETEQKLCDQLQSTYKNAVVEIQPDIANYLRSNYNITISDNSFEYDGGKLTLENANCSIQISFSPSLEEIIQNISGYANAVNGTLAYFNEEQTTQKIELYNQGVTKTDKDGNIFLQDDAKKYYEKYSSDTTNTTHEEYIKNIVKCAENYFKADNNSYRWQIIDFKMKETSSSYDTKQEKLCGEIKILMFYDLSSYKKEEIQSCYQTIRSLNGDTSIIETTMQQYYNTYISSSTGKFSIVNGKLVVNDTRNELYEKLLADGTLLYIPISGLPISLLNGLAGYSGFNAFDKGTFDFTTATSEQIWNHIYSLKQQEFIISDLYTSESLAEAYFYNKYGLSYKQDTASTIDTLINTATNTTSFYLGSSPAPGGLYAIYSSENQVHVGCVDSVDYDNKTITITDVEVSTLSNDYPTINIKKQMSFKEFYSYIQYVGSYFESYDSAWIKYINPVKK